MRFLSELIASDVLKNVLWCLHDYNTLSEQGNSHNLKAIKKLHASELMDVVLGMTNTKGGLLFLGVEANGESQICMEISWGIEYN